MCEECPPEGAAGLRRRRLVTWGLALPAAAAAATVPLGATPASAEALAVGYAHRRGGTRHFAPLPATARQLPVPPEGYRLDKLGPNAYGVVVGAAQSAFVVTAAGVVVIDAPGSFATALPAAIKRVTDKPVSHVIYSHSHTDHIGAANIFTNVVRIAHARTKEILAANNDPARPLPTVTFEDSYTLDVGGEKFVLTYPGPSHETGNIIISVPGQRLVVLIDVALPGWAPYRAFGTADSPPGVIRAHREVLKLDFDTFVGGHLYRWGTKADVRESYEFVSDVWAETGRAIAITPVADYLAKVEPGNTWAGLALWFDALADKAEPVILRKWVTRLGAVDVFTRENIKIMAVAQRVDQPKDL